VEPFVANLGKHEICSGPPQFGIEDIILILGNIFPVPLGLHIGITAAQVKARRKAESQLGAGLLFLVAEGMGGEGGRSGGGVGGGDRVGAVIVVVVAVEDLPVEKMQGIRSQGEMVALGVDFSVKNVVIQDDSGPALDPDIGSGRSHIGRIGIEEVGLRLGTGKGQVRVELTVPGKPHRPPEVEFVAIVVGGQGVVVGGGSRVVGGRVPEIHALVVVLKSGIVIAER